MRLEQMNNGQGVKMTVNKNMNEGWDAWMKVGHVNNT